MTEQPLRIQIQSLEQALQQAIIQENHKEKKRLQEQIDQLYDQWEQLESHNLYHWMRVNGFLDNDLDWLKPF